MAIFCVATTPNYVLAWPWYRTEIYDIRFALLRDYMSLAPSTGKHGSLDISLARHSELVWCYFCLTEFFCPQVHIICATVGITWATWVRCDRDYSMRMLACLSIAPCACLWCRHGQLMDDDLSLRIGQICEVFISMWSNFNLKFLSWWAWAADTWALIPLDSYRSSNLSHRLFFWLI